MLSMDAVRTKVLAGAQPPAAGLRTVECWRRNDAVRIYALRRSGGRCEMCDQVAPFLDELGSPFLEVHHIPRLVDDGPDAPGNVAALCPNWHRAAHFGSEKEALRTRLLVKIASLEGRSDP